MFRAERDPYSDSNGTMTDDNNMLINKLLLNLPAGLQSSDPVERCSCERFAKAKTTLVLAMTEYIVKLTGITKSAPACGVAVYADSIEMAYIVITKMKTILTHILWGI